MMKVIIIYYVEEIKGHPLQRLNIDRLGAHMRGRNADLEPN